MDFQNGFHLHLKSFLVLLQKVEFVYPLLFQ